MMSITNRTPERFNLFNPAFCGVVLLETISSYRKSSEKALPYPLIYLILSVVLHEETRGAVPRHGKSTLHAWLQNCGHLKIEFPDRCKEFLEVTNSALSFLILTESVQVIDGGIHSSALKKPKGLIYSSEMMDILKCAEILGKLFAGSGSVGTTYSMFGVKP